MYIVFEGVDTSGKTTQINLLKKRYKDAIITKEPGGTSVGVKIRELLLKGEVKSPLSEMFLFLADRAELITEIIKPNINSLVLSDRSFISGIAYAKSADKLELSLDEIIKVNSYALDGVLPDLVFLFIVDEETISKRLGAKELDAIEKRGIKYLLKVQDYMREITKKMNLKTIEIDASDSVNNIEEKIFNEIESHHTKEDKK